MTAACLLCVAGGEVGWGGYEAAIARLSGALQGVGWVELGGVEAVVLVPGPGVGFGSVGWVAAAGVYDC